MAFLEEFLEDPEFTRVIKLAYDPLVTFGVLNVVIPLEKGEHNFDEETYDIFAALSSRRLTGNNARAIVVEHMCTLNDLSQILMFNILKKDLRAGFSMRSINKAVPNTIKYPAYLRCSTIKQVPLSRLNWKNGVYAQMKADGMFCNITVSGSTTSSGITEISTRNGQKFNKYFNDRIAGMLLPGYQYHGEIVVYDYGSLLLPPVLLDRKTGNGLVNSVLKGGDAVWDTRYDFRFILWDMIELAHVENRYCSVTYENRFEALKVVLSGLWPRIQWVEGEILYSEDESVEYFNWVTQVGHEGIIVKDRQAIWKDGTSQLQVKMKAEKECEMIITGILPGLGKYENTCGSIQCESLDGLVETKVSGFTDDTRDAIWRSKEDWLDSIVTVRFNEVTDNKQFKNLYSLFLPRFIELRQDKDIADTTDYILNL